MRNVALSMACSTLLTFVMTACGGDKPAPAPAPPPAPAEPAKPAEAPPAPAPAVPPTPAGATLKPDAEGVVHLTGDDLMHYNAARIEVPADKPVKIELAHIGKMTAEQMGHNVVILKSGNDPMQFSAKAVTAKATGYIPDELKGEVIANSKVVGGGEKVQIEFHLPGPGTYPFLCSFPGHAALMKGELVAQ